MPMLTRLLHSVVALSFTAACAAGAQTAEPVGSPAEMQATCKNAAANVSRPQADTSYEMALRVLPSCGDAGAAELARAWRSAPDKRSSLRVLSATSAQTRDQRIFEAVRATAKDQSKPLDQRLAAMEVLVNYFDPLLYADFFEPIGRGPHPGQYVSFGSSSHDVSRPGAKPLSTSAKQEIVRVFRDLAATDPNERIKNASAYVADYLAARS